jgi:hypothetical protein
MSGNRSHPGTDTYLTISNNDHGAYLWIAVLLSAGFSTVTLCARLALKYKQYGADDLAIVAAQVCPILQS